MKFLISQLYLLALFALPFVSTSCSDDDDNSTKVEISSLGVEDGTTIVTGQIIQLEAQIKQPTRRSSLLMVNSWKGSLYPKHLYFSK